MIRSTQASGLLEYFLLSAITAILSLRFYLSVTDYPKIGGSHLHIAHMLYGGILLTIAVFLLLLYVNRGMKNVGAVIGGLGFGIFIDELGKFITADNNYFFQPTIALIYVIFVALFLIIQAMERYATLTPQEYVANAIDIIKEITTHNLDASEKVEALDYLKKSGLKDNFTEDMRRLISQTMALPNMQPSAFEILRKRLLNIGQEILQEPLVQRILLLILICQAFISLGHALATSLSHHLSFILPKILVDQPVNIADHAEALFSTISATLVFVGLVSFTKNRLHAFRLFRIAVLVSIFFTQFFAFYDDQFYALSGLVLNLLILFTINQTLQRLNHPSTPLANPVPQP